MDDRPKPQNVRWPPIIGAVGFDGGSRPAIALAIPRKRPEEEEAQFEPVGACCIDYDCFIATEANCIAESGTWHGAGSTCSPDPCCPCEDAAASYVVDVDGTPYTVLLIADCTWYVADGPCPGSEMILFGNSCGWFLTVQESGVWSVTGVGPTNQSTPVGGPYIFPFDANCDLTAATVTVAP